MMSPTAIPSADARLHRQDVLSAALARNWRVVALRGAVAILFGLLTLLMPLESLATLVYLFAAYLLVDGGFGIAAAVKAARKHERWGLLVVEGVVDILAAAAALASPGLAILVFVYLVAAWSIVSGGLMAVAAFRLHLDHGRWLLATAGLVSILFGILLAASPVGGAIVLTVWLGAYGLVFGVMLVALAIRLRGRHLGGAA